MIAVFDVDLRILISIGSPLITITSLWFIEDCCILDPVYWSDQRLIGPRCSFDSDIHMMISRVHVRFFRISSVMRCSLNMVCWLLLTDRGRHPISPGTRA